jgi:hypothetical protein
MENNMKFSEYLNSKGKTVEQPVVAAMADKLETEPKPVSKAQAKTKKAGKKHDQVKEFVDANGKLVEKPATEIVADYKGAQVNAPEKGKPYKNGKDVTVPSIGKGLADEGPKDLVYNPNLKGGNSDNIPGGTNVKSFLDETRNMSTEEFARHMKGKIGFDAIKSVKDLVKLSETNKSLFFNLAYEVKRNGKLSDLLEALLGIPETYKTIAQLVKEDATESRVKYLYNAINEAVAPPIGMDDIDSGEGGEGDDEDEMDLDHPEDEEGMGDEDMGDEGDDEEGMGDEEEGGDEDMGDEDMGDGEMGDMGGEDMGGEGSPPPMPGKFPSFKQKFGM